MARSTGSLLTLALMGMLAACQASPGSPVASTGTVPPTDGAKAATSPTEVCPTAAPDAELAESSGCGRGYRDGAATSALFGSIANLQVDATGRLLMVDHQHVIRALSPDGAVSTLAGREFGMLVRAETMGYGGAFASIDGSATCAKVGTVSAMTTGPNGDVVFYDYDNMAVRRLSDGRVTTLAGHFATGAGGTLGSYADGAGAEAAFSIGRGLAIAHDGSIFLVDSSNHRIRKVTPSGEVTTFAGSGPTGQSPDGSWGGYVDGPGASARFNQPSDMVIDANDNLFVFDSANYRVRKITPTGMVTTFAGSGRMGNDDGQGASVSVSFTGGAMTMTPSGHILMLEGTWPPGKPGILIRDIAPDGLVTTRARFSQPVTTELHDANREFGAIAAAPDGTIYLADRQRIYRLEADGTTTTPIAGQPACLEKVGPL